MGHGASGGGRASDPVSKIRDKKLTKALVIEDIKIIETTREIPIPKITYIPEEQLKYVTKEEEQVKYNTKEEDTTRFNTVEKDTIQYRKVEELTTKFIPKEKIVEYERPVPKDVPYERPVVHNKEYTLASVKDMDNIKALMELLPAMSKAIDELKTKVEGLTNYKLAEKIIPAPRIEWIPTTVERIIWKDVERESPKE